MASVLSSHRASYFTVLKHSTDFFAEVEGSNLLFRRKNITSFLKWIDQTSSYFPESFSHFLGGIGWSFSAADVNLKSCLAQKRPMLWKWNGFRMPLWRNVLHMQSLTAASAQIISDLTSVSWP